MLQQGSGFQQTTQANIKVIIRDCTAITAPKPVEIGTSGDAWADDGWLVTVHFHKARHSLHPKSHISQIAPLLPSKYSPINSEGNGNQGAYLASISDELGDFLLNLLNDEALERKIQDEKRHVTEDAIDKAIWARSDVPDTEKEQLVLSRRGQGAFRRELEKIEPRCRITGLAEREHLRASHIKPWRDASNLERLDGNNGLLLAPHVDHLFDRGYLTFTEDGQVLLSSALTKAATHALGIDSSQNVGKFNSIQSKYLNYHCKHVFLG